MAMQTETGQKQEKTEEVTLKHLHAWFDTTWGAEFFLH